MTALDLSPAPEAAPPAKRSFDTDSLKRVC